jgi:hypothetical protein
MNFPGFSLRVNNNYVPVMQLFSTVHSFQIKQMAIGTVATITVLAGLYKGLRIYRDIKRLSRFSESDAVKFCYRGGFQQKMDVKEASLILGARYIYMLKLSHLIF